MRWARLSALFFAWPAGTLLKIPGAFQLPPPLHTLEHYACVVNATKLVHFSIEGRHFNAVGCLQHKSDARVHLVAIDDFFICGAPGGAYAVELPPAGVTERAVHLRSAAALKAWPPYHIFENNCEHLARFVATGRTESTQVNDFMERLR